MADQWCWTAVSKTEIFLLTGSPGGPAAPGGPGLPGEPFNWDRTRSQQHFWLLYEAHRQGYNFQLSHSSQLVGICVQELWYIILVHPQLVADISPCFWPSFICKRAREWKTVEGQAALTHLSSWSSWGAKWTRGSTRALKNTKIEASSVALYSHPHLLLIVL